MNRPKITCHMVMSLDGKSVGKFTETDSYAAQVGEFLKLHSTLDKKAVIIGRTTCEEFFSDSLLASLDAAVVNPIERVDYIAQHQCEKYAVVVDTSGKLLWKTGQISFLSDGNYEHIVAVLTERVSDAYLAHLQKIGATYIFGGKDRLNLSLVMEKLKTKLDIDEALLEGGGTLNGSFLQSDLIDAMSVYLIPTVDGGANARTIVEALPKYGDYLPVSYKLENIEKLKHGIQIIYGKSV